MRIDLSEHCDLVRGASETEETAEGVRCSRFPGELAETVFGPEGLSTENARATSGIRVGLVTDAAEISMRLARGSVFNEDGAAVDVLLDRAECRTFFSDEDAEDFVVTLELAPADREDGHEVEIYLPHRSEVLIRDFELSDGSLFRPNYIGDDRILFLGDGVTQGCAATSPFRTYPALLAAELHTDFLNWGTFGSPLDSRLAEAAMSLEWQTVILACGVNDYREARPMAEFEEDLRRSLAFLTIRPGARVFVSGAWQVPPNESVRNAEGLTPADYRAAGARITREFPDVRLLDAPAVKDGHRYFAEDELHPADDGMAAIAEVFHRNLAAGV